MLVTSSSSVHTFRHHHNYPNLLGEGSDRRDSSKGQPSSASIGSAGGPFDRAHSGDRDPCTSLSIAEPQLLSFGCQLVKVAVEKHVFSLTWWHGMQAQRREELSGTTPSRTLAYTI